MNIVIKFDIFSECKFGLQAAQQFIFKPSHYSQPLGRGEIPHSARGLTQTDAGNKESSTCGVGGWVVGGWDKTLREGISPHWENWQRTLRVCAWVHMERACSNSDFYKHAWGNSISVILAFLTFLPANFQSLWGSLFQSSDITRGVPRSASRSLSHKPTHIWKWEEGNPRWWLKGSCCQGEFSPHLFFVCVRVYY